METDTFYRIMKEVFIPYVNYVRGSIQHDNKHAVLVVDGHVTRYNMETIDLLRAADIDLLVIPAHSSHLVQPLDITLNNLIKTYFRSHIK